MELREKPANRAATNRACLLLFNSKLDRLCEMRSFAAQRGDRKTRQQQQTNSNRHEIHYLARSLVNEFHCKCCCHCNIGAYAVSFRSSDCLQRAKICDSQAAETTTTTQQRAVETAQRPIEAVGSLEAASRLSLARLPFAGDKRADTSVKRLSRYT